MHSETTATEITKQDIRPKNLQIDWSFFASYGTHFKQNKMSQNNEVYFKNKHPKQQVI